MKNFIIKISFLLLSFCATAQTTPSTSTIEVNTTFGQQMATMFSALERNRVPHGLLLDLAMEFTNVPAFDGTLTDSTFVRPKVLKEIYNTLLMSRIRDVSTGFVTPDQFENSWFAQRAEEHIALSGLYFKYSRFATNAATSGKLIYTNGKIYDRYIGGVWQNPYQEMKTFAMAIPVDVFTGLNLKVKIPQAIFYSNYANGIQSIAIDFEDGLGYRLVNFDQLVNVNYASEGIRTWKYRLTLTNGQTMLSHSKIKIKKGLRISNITTDVGSTYRTANTITWNNCSPTTSDLYRLDIQSTGTFNGFPGKARIFIDDAGNDCKITKPLIVVEGFDLTTITSPETRFSSGDYEEFLLSVSEGGNLSSLINGNPIIAGDQQYDIIYVNWDNGLDYIERNALVVEEVIKWVNAQKAIAGSTEKNVVLGQSMGGIVCRYAIRDMEQRGLIHNVRLFASHDSPQQGANVPLSIQYLFHNVRNQVVQSPAYFLFNTASQISQNLSNSGLPINPINDPLPIYGSLLDRPATAQMLINRTNGYYAINNDLHNSFYSNLNAKGFPTQNGIRCVAISNGSECGKTQNFNQGDVIIAYSGNKKLSFIQNALLPIASALGGALLDPDLFAVTALTILPGSSKFTAFLEDRALYQNGGSKIHDLSLSYTKKILWLWSVTTYIINKQINQPTNINKHFDNYGGGFIDIGSYTGALSVPGLYVRDKFCLVPTPSSLSINATTDSDYKISYIGAQPPLAPLNSPFTNFTTAFKSATNLNNNNEKHLEFNARNGNWLAAEMNVLPETTNCSFLCNSSPISGSEVICSTTLNTFTAPTGGAFYEWSIISGNNLVTLTNSNSQVATITPLAGVSGSITMRVNISGISTTLSSNRQSCGFLTKTVWVGAPSFTLEYSYNEINTVKSTLCIISNNPSISTLQQGITNVKFKYVNSNTILQNGLIDCKRTTNPYCMEVIVTNICGSTTLVYDCYLNRQNLSNNTYKVYPNPSKDIVNIDLREENNFPEKGATISGELFDMMGQSKSNVNIKDNKAIFSVLGLPRGIYVLKIYINDKTESHQIAVE